MRKSKKMISSDGRHVIEVIGEGEHEIVLVDGVRVEVNHDRDQADLPNGKDS
jgi:hypothetical protein